MGKPSIHNSGHLIAPNISKVFVIKHCLTNNTHTCLLPLSTISRTRFNLIESTINLNDRTSDPPSSLFFSSKLYVLTSFLFIAHNGIYDKLYFFSHIFQVYLPQILSIGIGYTCFINFTSKIYFLA